MSQKIVKDSCINDVMSELGEVAKERNISNKWGASNVHKPRPNLRTEMGQLLFTVYQLAEILGIDAEKELALVVDDFRERYERQGHTGSSNYLGEE
jgi:NTP pyrophosphatase (non-canonical NTP hydrolase)